MGLTSNIRLYSVKFRIISESFTLVQFVDHINVSYIKCVGVETMLSGAPILPVPP